MITLTETAEAKIGEFANQMPEAKDRDLRIFIQGAGCSGFAYGFTFDERQPGDTVVQAGKIKVLIDPQSAPYLRGSTVDYVDDERGSGFTVDNPNEAGLGGGCGGGCSCG
ncbi:MAG TPA: iron-sulfur cluster assembly accessory protein [Acidobacteria bacterium]|nr:iron-sulfur cluster assembly accessory protein [Acidobacteriota bacterium]